MSAKRLFHQYVAMLATVGILGTGLAATAIVTPPAATAADPTPQPAYATAKLTETADGTGHGTSGQTFVNTGNGFRVGDDTPNDGVVSSGDVVEYSLKLTFTAAQKRQVKVAWDLTNAPYLEAPDMVAGSCQSGQQVTARRDGASCVYTVSAGAAETLEQHLVLTAKDTNGTVQDNQKPKLTVTRDSENGASVSYPTDVITVVSAPAADLIVDNGGYPDKTNYAWERYTTWKASGNLTGTIDLKVKPLTYKGYSTSHGASTNGAWSATVDVSKWPTGTTWTMDGTTLTVKDGRLRVENATGDKTLTWTMPATAVKDMTENSETHYDIQVIPDKDSFSAKGADALKNMGTGIEPGMNGKRDDSTADSDTGAKAGYPYANNDWSRGIIERPSDTYSPIQYGTARPYTTGKTLFDPESLTFDKAERMQFLYHYGSDSSGDSVAGARDSQHPGAQLRTIIDMDAQNVGAIKPGTQPWVSGEWDPSEQQWDGSVTVTQGDRPLTMGVDYTVSYTRSKPAQWIQGTPQAGDRQVRGIRVTFTQGVTYGSGAGTVRTMITTRVVKVPGKNADRVTTQIRGNIQTTDNTGVDYYGSDHATIVAPQPPTASIDANQAITDRDGNTRKQDQAQSGDIVTYTLDPSVHGIQLSNTGMTPTITIPYPAGLVNPKVTGTDWTLTTTGSGSNRTLTFTLNTKDGKTIPSTNTAGDATLPALVWTGVVGNKAAGVTTASATLTVNVDANGNAPAYPKVTSPTTTLQFTVPALEGVSGFLSADKTRVEINDPMTFTFNLYAKGPNHTDTASTVIHTPSNQDSNLLGKNNSGLDGSWHDYDRGNSKYSGTWTLDKPLSLNMENSTATTVKYSTTVAWTDNPTDYTWKDWSQLSDTEKNKVTAILVTSTFENNAAVPVAAANGTITITPHGQHEKRPVQHVARPHPVHRRPRHG